MSLKFTSIFKRNCPGFKASTDPQGIWRTVHVQSKKLSSKIFYINKYNIIFWERIEKPSHSQFEDIAKLESVF